MISKMFMTRAAWKHLCALMCQDCGGTGYVVGGFDDCGGEAHAVCNHGHPNELDKEQEVELRAQEDEKFFVQLERLVARDHVKPL